MNSYDKRNPFFKNSQRGLVKCISTN